MPSFLYFLPNQKEHPTPKLLGELGLAYAFEGKVNAAPVTNLEGEDGLLVADRDRLELGRLAYHPEQQEWQAWTTPAGKRVRIGFYRDAPPNPGILQRRKLLDGPSVELVDERGWQIPIAREAWFIEDDVMRFETRLPQSSRMNAEGKWEEGAVLPRYARLWEIARLWYDAIRAPGTEASQKVFADIFNLAADVLSANYLVGPAECSLLGLLSFDHAAEVLNACIQRDVLEEVVQKKMLEETEKAPAGAAPTPGSAAANGPADSPPVIAPASLT